MYFRERVFFLLVKKQPFQISFNPIWCESTKKTQLGEDRYQYNEDSLPFHIGYWNLVVDVSRYELDDAHADAAQYALGVDVALFGYGDRAFGDSCLALEVGFAPIG